MSRKRAGTVFRRPERALHDTLFKSLNLHRLVSFSLEIPARSSSQTALVGSEQIDDDE
ncbi:MAG: hypothetical protein HY774_13140 [Acidobacteria bacterium]|nr:hypothetical protein [Acidobacteriota bacterium]